MNHTAAAAVIRTELVIPAAANLPKILDAARERLARLLSYPLRFTELHGSDMLPAREARRMEPRRMPRREAINLVGAAFLKHTDVVSLRVGSPRPDGSVTPPGQIRLTEETGISMSRLRRAIRDGVRAGYWTRHQPRLRYSRQDGAYAYCAFRTIYRLTDRFFVRLGLGKRLVKERQRAAERAGGRRRIYALALLEARDQLRKRSRAVARAPRSVDDAENDARLLNSLRLRLRMQYPGWPPERIDAEAKRLRRGF